MITLSETHLDEYVSDEEIAINGYTCERRDRNRSGGGVAVYVREGLNYVVKTEFMPAELEIIVIEIHEEKQKPYNVVTWYRPPSSKSELFTKFEDNLEMIDGTGRDFIILGDMNCDMKKSNCQWQAKQLSEIFHNNRCEQLIQEPTRITSNSSSLIDLIVTELICYHLFLKHSIK